MKKILLALILVSCFLPLFAHAQSTSELPSELVATIETIAEEAMESQKIPGMSVAVAVDNQLKYSHGFGLSDLENSVTTKPDTCFRTASIAKSITACAVMQLYEQGKVDLDAPIQTYCPEYPEKEWKITVRDLLCHVSGVRHYKTSRESTGKEFFPTLTASLKLFKDDPLKHEPRTKFTYTTFGYTLLGCVVEQVSGMSFEDYLRKNIFEPAGMESTHVDHVRYLIPNRARGYAKLDRANHFMLPASLKSRFQVGDVYNASLHDTSMKVPGGGLVSTSEDLVRFTIALHDNKLLKQETRQLMWTRQKLTDGSPIGYGLGWKLEQDEGGPLLISHSGGQAGTSTFLVTIPQANLTVATMCNLQGVSIKNTARKIGMAVLQSR